MNRKPIYKTPEGEQAVMAVYERLLSEWPESTESLQIETRHGRTHVLARGHKDADPLVLLHGAGSNALAWGGDVPDFARHFRVYAVDTPGEPGRSSHHRIGWRDDAIVEWLEDVVNALSESASTQILLAGISQGGYVALRFASARAERVKALALLAPGGVSQPKLSFFVRGLTYGMYGRRGATALTRRVMGDCEVDDAAKEYMDLIYSNFRSRTDAQPLLTDSQLRALTMPVLLMLGGRDAIFDSKKTGDRFARVVGHVDIRLLPEAGHALINVAPAMVPFLIQAAA
ncbi:MAG: alpha/beta fold hydrolase [Actinobacteria bacterium]|nr:alpha/beta fold hydrolase [Actinomycetota bacterium]